MSILQPVTYRSVDKPPHRMGTAFSWQRRTKVEISFSTIAELKGLREPPQVNALNDLDDYGLFKR